MEFAYYIKNMNDLNNIPSKYSRIYIGWEFCSNFILKKEQINKIIEFHKKSKKNVTFIIPYIFQKDFNKVKKMISYLGSFNKKFEVIFNDLGVLNLIKKEKYLQPVLGRLLAKQKVGLDPLIKDKLNLSSYDNKYLKKSAVQSLNNFLIENSIYRVELNNSPNGINLEGINKNIKISIHYPLIYLSTSRYCKTFCSEKNKKLEDLNEYSKCNKICNKIFYESDLIFKSFKVILIGNTYFIYYNNIPKIKKIINGEIIDRLIYTPFDLKRNSLKKIQNKKKNKIINFLHFIKKERIKVKYLLVESYSLQNNEFDNNYKRIVINIKSEDNILFNQKLLKLHKYLTHYKKYFIKNIKYLNSRYIHAALISILETKNSRLTTYFYYKKNTPINIKEREIIEYCKSLNLNFYNIPKPNFINIEMIGIDFYTKEKMVLKLYEKIYLTSNEQILNLIPSKYKILFTNLIKNNIKDNLNFILMCKKYNRFAKLIGLKIDIPFKDNFKKEFLNKNPNLNKLILNKDIEMISLNIDYDKKLSINIYYKYHKDNNFK